MQNLSQATFLKLSKWFGSAKPADSSRDAAAPAVTSTAMGSSRHSEIARTVLNSIFLYAEARKPRVPMSQLRDEMVRTVVDCSMLNRSKMLRAVHRSSDGLDLWLLRSELFQCIAHERGQVEAARRINALKPFFAEWIPKSMLVEV